MSRLAYFSRHGAKPFVAPIAFVGMLIAVGLASSVMGLPRQVLQDVANNLVGWRAAAASHFLISLALFVVAYAGALFFFIPVALILTFASGFIFGPAPGAAASVIGACLGATLSYGFARSSFARSSFKGSALRDLTSKIARPDGLLGDVRARVFRLSLAIRLLPLTPFTLFSLAAGAVGAAFPPFLAGTALGVLPECCAYAVLGRRLGSLLLSGRAINVHDIAQPGLLIPLTVLAALCLVSLFLGPRGGAAPGSIVD